MPFTQLASGSVTFSGATTPGHVYTWTGGAAAANDFIILGCNVHNGSASLPTGYSVVVSRAPDAVVPQGVYCWCKVATGGETSVTIVTNADREVALSYFRYSGVAHTSPVDKTDIKVGTQKYVGYNNIVGTTPFGDT
jgi:hypothetical protein